MKKVIQMICTVMPTLGLAAPGPETSPLLAENITRMEWGAFRLVQVLDRNLETNQDSLSEFVASVTYDPNDDLIVVMFGKVEPPENIPQDQQEQQCRDLLEHFKSVLVPEDVLGSNPYVLTNHFRPPGGPLDRESATALLERFDLRCRIFGFGTPGIDMRVRALGDRYSVSWEPDG